MGSFAEGVALNEAYRPRDALVVGLFGLSPDRIGSTGRTGSWWKPRAERAPRKWSRGRPPSTRLCC